MNYSWPGLVGMQTRRVTVSSFRLNCSSDQCEKSGIGVAVAGIFGRIEGVLRRGAGLVPDGHFKFPRLWSPKFPQAGRFNYGVFAASRVSLAAASFSR